jgi:hypothetical protein
MSVWDISEGEQALLNAALNPDSTVAVASWQGWAGRVVIETAPMNELRLLLPVYDHLSRVAPEIELPNKLRGKARANFSKAQFLAYATLPIIQELSLHSPVMMTKGMAMCVRFNAWSWRPMLDIDVYVPRRAADNAFNILAERGWTPHHGMTWPSLRHRSSFRRDSWNFTKGRAEIDLHWRMKAGSLENWLARQMWKSGEQFEYSGQPLLLQSPEFAFISSLNHGFLQGSHSDVLQTVIDTAWLLSICKAEELAHLISKAELSEPFRRLAAILAGVGLSNMAPLVELSEKAKRSKSANFPFRRARPTETAMLRRPWLYRLWSALGRKARLERRLLRWTGPFSKPLTPAPPRTEYDLRDCAVLDEVAGPGWSWPEPDKSCFWADRADARLLVPLRKIDDHLLVVTLADQRIGSPNRSIDVFANGLYVAKLMDSACAVMITRSMLFGRWVELSFRASSYLGDRQEYPATLTFPVRKLRILSRQDITQVFSGHNVTQLQLRLLRGEEPHTSKLARIMATIENSSYKKAERLPPDFDPLLYVLSYPDLFEHEVDPYEHFSQHGWAEKRLWR